MRCIARVLLLAAATAAAPALAQIEVQVLVTGLAQPVATASPLNDGRLFVAEKGGTIQVVANHQVSEFLRIPVATEGERGLLGLAFDPDYGNASSATGYRRFFVNYIDAATKETVIASWRSNDTGTGVQAGSRVEVMRIAQPAFENHKGGWIGFKPGDARHLYIATGDGGSANDPLNHAQNPGVLLGKMLRIDVTRDDFADPDVNYGVPADNPLVGQPGARGEIWASGLRNPWRNGFDRATGDLWIGDVGQGAREEVDLIRVGSSGGQNFGWRVREGDIPTPGVGDPPLPGLTEPVLVYDHGEGASIVGGTVMQVGPLGGLYVFGDFVSGRVWTLDPKGTLSFADAVEITDVLNAQLGTPLAGIVSFGEGFHGEAYIVEIGGRIVQVVPEPAPALLLAAGLAALAFSRRRPGAPRAPSVA